VLHHLFVQDEIFLIKERRLWVKGGLSHVCVCVYITFMPTHLMNSFPLHIWIFGVSGNFSSSSDLTFSSCHVLFVFVFVCLLFPFFCFYFLNCRFLKVRVWLRNGRAGSRRSSTAQREEDGLERASSTDLRESHDTHTHMHTSTHIHTSTHTHTFFSCQQSFAS